MVSTEPERITPDAQRWRDSGGSGLVISHISAHHPERQITLEVGQRDIRIRRSFKFATKPRSGGGIRSSVTQFTNASRRRLMFTARNFPGLDIMLTVT